MGWGFYMKNFVGVSYLKILRNEREMALNEVIICLKFKDCLNQSF